MSFEQAISPAAVGLRDEKRLQDEERLYRGASLGGKIEYAILRERVVGEDTDVIFLSPRAHSQLCRELGVRVLHSFLGVPVVMLTRPDEKTFYGSVHGSGSRVRYVACWMG